jgi:hypothetical protein
VLFQPEKSELLWSFTFEIKLSVSTSAFSNKKQMIPSKHINKQSRYIQLYIAMWFLKKKNLSLDQIVSVLY